jgi:hypothetical protein
MRRRRINTPDASLIKNFNLARKGRWKLSNITTTNFGQIKSFRARAADATRR